MPERNENYLHYRGQRCHPPASAGNGLMGAQAARRGVRLICGVCSNGNGGQVKKILRHLGLWETCLRETHRQARSHDSPIRNAPHTPEFTYLPLRDRTQTGDNTYLPC